MAIYNLGSINADLLYAVPHLPRPGETLASTAFQRGLGGKGANMSVAASRGAARVVHMGAVGADGRWARDLLTEYGVDTRHIAVVDQVTGHAVILLDPGGENTIIINYGANHAIDQNQIGLALSEASPGDILLMQNETTQQTFSAETGSDLGLRVVYAAAPFNADAVQSVLPYLDMLILNAIEAQQLEQALGEAPGDLGLADVIVTLGAQGCRWFQGASGQVLDFPALPVTSVDTTGAGDTFTGYLLAGLDRGMPMEQAIGLATKAAALMVTRVGTADVIPDLLEIQQMGQPPAKGA
ncbi:MAG: ribokinase [Anderseniella sp.]|jgi:ribokinase|nr:ribokinase [Anderseniella sp.]